MKAPIKICVLAAGLSLVSAIGIAQQRVHAVTGMVTAIHPKVEMISIEMDDGTPLYFHWVKRSDGAIEFDKNVKADATAVDKFDTGETHVIVYYFGDGDVRTAVALHDLGKGPVEKKTGAVVKFNKHDRLLTLKNSEGTEESIHIDSKTVADTSIGVATNFKFDYAKGDRVRVTSATVNGISTALLIAPPN